MSELWILWKMWFQKCEFCQKWYFRKVNFVKKNWDFQCVNFWIKCGFFPQCASGWFLFHVHLTEFWNLGYNLFGHPVLMCMKIGVQSLDNFWNSNRINWKIDAKLTWHCFLYFCRDWYWHQKEIEDRLFNLCETMAPPPLLSHHQVKS